MVWWALALRLVGIGWYIALSIVIGIGGGVWLDKKLNTIPIFMLVGVVVGSVVAFYGVYKLVKPLMDESDGEKGKPKGGDS